MRAHRIGLLAAVVTSSALGLGCATSPRLKEIVALEGLRADPQLSDPDRRAFDLLAAADVLLVQACRYWERGKDQLARRDALMGQIKLKTALALLQAERLQARSAELDAQIALSQDEATRLDDQLATDLEGIAITEKLRTMTAASAEERKALSQQMDVAKKQAASEHQRMTDQLTAIKRRAEVLDGLRQVELTLKTAETVEAPRYAKSKYGAATGVLQDAHKEFDAGHWDEALARATLAQSEATDAVTLARPQYEKAAQAMSNNARDRNLEADATAIVGVTTRLDRQGDLQRLVLLLHGLFADKRSVLLPDRAAVLDALKELLAKYPSYPLQLTGFTADQGKPDDLVALSLARANAVYWALVSRGIDAKRFSVDGKGSAQPIADDSTAAGRGENARIELSILYHITQ